MIESQDGDGAPIDEEGEQSPGTDGDRVTRGTSRTRGGESEKPTEEAGDAAESEPDEDGSGDGERITRGTSRTRGT